MGVLKDVGPAGLVPAAWIFAAAAVLGVVTARTVLIAMTVMSVLLVIFFVTTLSEMTGPVLSAWQRVLAVGGVVTILGTVDLVVTPGSDPLAALALYAWIVLPAAAYIRTWTAMSGPAYRHVYLVGAALSLLGLGLFAAGGAALLGDATVAVAGLAVVGLGQTAGIVTAALQNGGRLGA
ncbi:hypothetical protein SAMN05216388_1006133 [Halorientalis persicus]|jgi:hypothetical protein|uniref:Uncharacterized protein n=1 Tax=Halorientalis persicus TaxID=1367881 RepID=A0A1H8KPB9_9EURY|nr:hypothetical protein [Halorientalis persicus]SEN94783.1 hypothetical protein SAMN05216388_1006133 [Halorientalis persicus]